MANTPLQQFAKKCCTRQHLSPEEWGILEDCTRLTCGAKKRFFLDGRKLAARFSGISKSGVYRAIERLVSKGWMVKTSGGTRNRKTGMFDRTEYRILSHEEWVKGKCCTCPTGGTGTCPKIANHLSQIRKPPVPRAGHSSVVPSVKTYGATPLCPQPSKIFFPTGQESKGEAHDVYPSSPTGGTGADTVPSFAEYDTAEHEWRARRGLGRGTTPDEVKEIHRLNREHAQPSIQ